MFTYIVASIFVLGVLIIVHELGHFWMARKMGVGVEKFSIGFGHPIFKKRLGDTDFLISWIPFGGYVKLIGEENHEGASPLEKPELAYNRKPVWRRMLIISAGPMANLIFAAIVFSLIYMMGIEMPDTKVMKVMENSPAGVAGILEGDRIVEIDGVEIKSWSRLAKMISESPEKELKITVERESGAIAYISITPETQIAETIFGEKIEVGRIGISPENVFKRYNPFHALLLGFKKSGEIMFLTLMVIVKIVQNVIPANNIGGPLMIFKIAGDQAQAGLIPLLMFMGVLSVNLGILNLLPIPILDGGHMIFLAIEAAKGSPLSLKGREIAQQVGMFLLISLMVFAFYNDITRFLTG